MIKKVNPIIKENDEIVCDIEVKPSKGEYVLFSINTIQWIEKFSKNYKDANCYKITKIIMNS